MIERLKAGVVGPRPRVVQIADLEGVAVPDGAGQLDLAALVGVVRRQGDAGLRQRTWRC